MKPLVSILIITFNHENFIKEAIESAINQTYSNTEIIVSDDCSTDRTVEILNVYKERFPDKIRIFESRSNQGVTSNHNKALKHSNGEFVCFMGGDDILLNDKVSIQVEFMINNPLCRISYHNLEVFDSSNNKFLYLFNDKNKPRIGKVGTSILFGTFNGACGTMLKREKDIIFDERISFASDWLFWIENLAKGGSILYINNVLARYRKHSNSVSSTTSSNKAFYERTQTLYFTIIKYPLLSVYCLTSFIRFSLIEILVRIKSFLM